MAGTSKDKAGHDDFDGHREKSVHKASAGSSLASAPGPFPNWISTR
jgi:hypothetical protein